MNVSEWEHKRISPAHVARAFLLFCFSVILRKPLKLILSAFCVLVCSYTLKAFQRNTRENRRLHGYIKTRVTITRARTGAAKHTENTRKAREKREKSPENCRDRFLCSAFVPEKVAKVEKVEKVARVPKSKKSKKLKSCPKVEKSKVGQLFL